MRQWMQHGSAAESVREFCGCPRGHPCLGSFADLHRPPQSPDHTPFNPGSSSAGRGPHLLPAGPAVRFQHFRLFPRPSSFVLWREETMPLTVGAPWPITFLHYFCLVFASSFVICHPGNSGLFEKWMAKTELNGFDSHTATMAKRQITTKAAHSGRQSFAQGSHQDGEPHTLRGSYVQSTLACKHRGCA